MHSDLIQRLQDASGRNCKIKSIALELTSIGNPISTVVGLARAAQSLRPGTEVQHKITGHRGVVQEEVSDSLMVHIRNPCPQMFCDPRQLTAIAALKAKEQI